MRRLSALFVTLLLASCAGPPRALDGVVRDALTGAPIAGATVRGPGGSATTDGLGRFTLPAAEGPLRASAPGYFELLRLELHGLEPFSLWPEHPDDEAVDAHLVRLERARELRDDPDDPALSARARARLRGEPLPVFDEGDIGAARLSLDAPPATIRIWRRSIDGETESCMGRIDVIPFEEYIAGVLPHEWIPSWDDESLRAGALAIRTYAWRNIQRGGKYDCADLDDTSRSQVYRDDRMERATQAVADTRGMAITVDGVLATGEYSAENGNPTALGVDDPLCDGLAVRGHGRGMCQWGSQRWALDGRDHLWIATHYYPGSAVEGGAPAADDYDAAFVRIDAPATMVSGASADVTVELDNVGRREWTAEGTRLGVSDGEPCPFYDDVSWTDDTVATGPDEYRYAPGTSGTFTFRVTAPEVSEATDVDDTLRLTHEGVGLFGPDIALQIRVTPRDGPPGPPPPPPPAPGVDGGAGPMDPPPRGGTGLSGGCSAAPGRGGAFGLLLLLGLALIRRSGA